MPVNNVISYAPYVNNTNPTPIYDATVNYNMGEVNSNYSEQNISVPQSYHKTITTTENYIDTRENADKIIDRSSRVLGTLSVVGAVVALFFWAI